MFCEQSRPRRPGPGGREDHDLALDQTSRPARSSIAEDRPRAHAGARDGWRSSTLARVMTTSPAIKTDNASCFAMTRLKSSSLRVVTPSATKMAAAVAVADCEGLRVD